MLLCLSCCAAAQMPADFTNDKIINIYDLAVMCEHWLGDVQPVNQRRISVERKDDRLVFINNASKS
jgi:hypothetical protein